MAVPSGAWQSALLQAIGAPVTPQTTADLNAWQRSEGGSASNNPFNTSQPGFGGVNNYNSSGIMQYPSAQQGLQATEATLNNGHYADIIASLKAGGNPGAFAGAVGASPWGSSGSLIGQILHTTPLTSMDTASKPTVGAVHPAQLGASLAAPAAQQANTGALSKFIIGQGQAVMNGKNFNIAGLDKLLQQQQAPPQVKQAVGGIGRVAAAAQQAAPNSGLGAALVKTAETQLGTPYKYGGVAKLGSETDCSGLIQATYASKGISIPRDTYDQWRAGTPVPLSKMQPGDAIYFHMGPQGPEHVGMYIGNGKMVEDPHTGDVVKIQSLTGYDKPVGARRFSK